jgi:flagellar motor switch protein FliN/FliY
MLSQAEIDALLNKATQLTQTEVDTLGEIGNISIGTSATTLFSLLGERVSMTIPRISLVSYEELHRQHALPFVAVTVEYTQGLKGTNLLIIKKDDAKVISSLMMGEDPTNIEEISLSDLHLSAVGEAMNQMMGAAATSMSQMFKTSINISPPKVKIIDLSEETLEDIETNETLVKVSFTLEIGKIVKSEVMQIIPYEFAKKMVDMLLPQREEDYEIKKSKKFKKELPKEISKAKSNDTDNSFKREMVPVNNFNFAELEPIDTPRDKEKIDLILDVPLEITVELGRTRKTIRDILSFGIGSIVELDKLAGEPVDILVNGKFIAKGEVVVIDENFGVRVTEILSPIERVNKLQ